MYSVDDRVRDLLFKVVLGAFMFPSFNSEPIRSCKNEASHSTWRTTLLKTLFDCQRPGHITVCIKHLRNYSLGRWLKLNTIRSIHLPWRSLHFPAIVRDCQLRRKLAASIREQDACTVGAVARLPASKSPLFFIYNQQFKISCHAS